MNHKWPNGWQIDVIEREHSGETVLIIQGPDDQGAAFYCQAGQARAEVLKDFISAFNPDSPKGKTK